MALIGVPHRRLEGGAKVPEGMDMVGPLLKMAGALLGRKADPDVRLRGFLGMEVADVNGAATVVTAVRTLLSFISQIRIPVPLNCSAKSCGSRWA